MERGNMVLIKELSQIAPAIQTVKEVSNIASAATSTNDDFWTKLERIIPSIDHLLETALKAKGTAPAQEKASGARQVLTDSGIQSGQGAVTAKLEKNAIAENENMVKIKNQFIAFLDNHLQQCVKENPNMTIGEAIQKLPFNVTQITALLQAYKMFKGG